MEIVLAAVLAAVAWSRWGEVGAALVAVAWAGWALWASIWWPFVVCPAPTCKGGKVRRPGKRVAWRRCSWCGGSGARVRWGRRAYEAVRPTKHRRR